MVRAMLDGSKTQTRRTVRFQPGDDTTVHVEHFHQTVIDRQGNEQPHLWPGPNNSTVLARVARQVLALWLNLPHMAIGRVCPGAITFIDYAPSDMG